MCSLLGYLVAALWSNGGADIPVCLSWELADRNVCPTDPTSQRPSVRLNARSIHDALFLILIQRLLVRPRRGQARQQFLLIGELPALERDDLAINRFGQLVLENRQRRIADKEVIRTALVQGGDTVDGHFNQV